MRRRKSRCCSQSQPCPTTVAPAPPPAAKCRATSAPRFPPRAAPAVLRKKRKPAVSRRSSRFASFAPRLRRRCSSAAAPRSAQIDQGGQFDALSHHAFLRRACGGEGKSVGQGERV